MLRLCQIWSILIGFVATGFAISARADIDPVTGAVGGDAAAQSFTEYCQRVSSTLQPEKFYAELDQADRAIAAGNQERAETALQDALRAASRGGRLNDSAIRCIGERATRRWFTTRLEIWRQGWGSNPEGYASEFDDMYVVAADRGAEGIVEVVSYQPAARFSAYYYAVENITEVAEWQRNFGTFQLPEEIAIARTCNDALGLLRDYANREHAKTLAAEDDSFNRPATQMERDAAQTLGGIGELAQAMAGMDINVADQQEALVVRRQVDESRKLLDVARALEIEPVGFDLSKQRLPSFVRAEQRGDTLLARANNEQLSLEVRDDYYDLARGYLGWCKCRDKAVIAANAQESIQPALLAQAERRDEQMEKMQAEMQQKTEAMQKSVDAMKKTEAEKQSFKDEADALEAELDF